MKKMATRETTTMKEEESKTKARPKQKEQPHGSS
jgi:hypothetical protein